MTTSRVEVVCRADATSRFSVLEVVRDCPIKTFVQDNGLTFAAGCGFYEATRPETVGGHKEIILMSVETGEFFAGATARERLGLPIGAEARTPKTAPDKVRVFVQSTSSNRKLAKGTLFLYQVEDWQPTTSRSTSRKSDHDALLQSVLDDPADDVRLVYADWCEDNSQPERAEFIRLQVKQTQLEHQAHFLPSGKQLDGLEEIKRCAESILDSRSPDRRTWRDRWLADLPDLVRPWAVWKRGFVELNVDGAYLGAFLGELSNGEPLPVTWRLHLYESGGNEELLDLVRKPPENLPPLVELDLSFSYCGDEYLAQVLEGAWLSRVSTLGLGFTAIGPASGTAIADCPFLTRLQVLSFDALHCDEGTSTMLGPAGLAALAESTHLTGLRELDLGQNPVLNEGLRALAASRTLTGLTWLNLFDAQVADDGVAALVDSPVVQHLRYLDLTCQNDLTDATLRAIAASPWLAQLETLSLGGSGYSDPDYRRRPDDPSTHELQLFSPAGWRALCESPRLGRLSGLRLDEFDGGQQEAIEALLGRRFHSGFRANVGMIWG